MAPAPVVPTPAPILPGAPIDPKKDMAPAVDPQAFAQAPAAGGEAGRSFNPAMFGDLGAGGSAFVFSPSSSRVSLSSTSTSTASSLGSSSSSRTRIPLAGRGAFKISDNESPRPMDRVFLTYNYFDRVSLGDGTYFGLHRELIGFEKTFLDGSASVGMRLPFLQSATDNGNVAGLFGSMIGDLTLIGKYAVINNRDTGNLVCVGLAVTLPTADEEVILADGTDFRSTLFQPYVGWIFNRGDFFAHAFHALVIPTEARDITVLNNDIGIGWWVARRDEGLIRGIVPTVEGHLFTPLSNRSANDIITAPDIFTLTAAVNLVLPGGSTIGAGIAAPFTGPRPNAVEALVSFNFRF